MRTKLTFNKTKTYHFLLSLILIVNLIGSIVSASIEISETKKRLFGGFSIDTRSALHKIHRQIEELNQDYKKATETWYTLHLLSEENLIEQLKLWPDGQNFREYIHQSLTTTIEFANSPDRSDIGFLAFHKLPDYESSLHLYEDPEKIVFVTGLEVLFEEHKFKPLSQSLSKQFLDLYYHIDYTLEILTQLRLEIEILRDQVLALDFEKENGYYLRHLSTEGRKTVAHLAEDIDTLLVKAKQLRTQKLLPAYHLITGLVYSTNYTSYPTTTEFKEDVRQLAMTIQRATPHLSQLGRDINHLIQSLSRLQERDQQTTSYTHEQFETLKNRVNNIFQELTELALQEQNVMNNDPSLKKQKWSQWLEENQSRYRDLFYQLYEILEYQTTPGTDIYEFQMEVFHLDSVQRQLYRNLEALLFGTMNHSHNTKDNRIASPKQSAQTIVKFRSAIVHRILRLHKKSGQVNCDQILNFL